MIIGFTKRRRRVSEGDALSGEDTFPLPIPLATLRTAEREHPMDIRPFGGSAIVELITNSMMQHLVQETILATQLRNSFWRPLKTPFLRA